MRTSSDEVTLARYTDLVKKLSIAQMLDMYEEAVRKQTRLRDRDSTIELDDLRDAIEAELLVRTD